MRSVGIVGAGISGMHLALRLQQFRVNTTVYAEQNPDEQRAARPLNFVARFGNTLARERAMGLDAFLDRPVPRIQVTVEADGAPAFCGELSSPLSFLDFRIYLPALMETYQRRGGQVHIGAVDRQRVRELSRHHDLLVVSSGGRSMGELFPRDPERSFLVEPKRRLLGAVLRGARCREPIGHDIHLVPGAGEIFHAPFATFGGERTALLIEAVPGGPLEPMARMSYEEDPDRFERTLLQTLATYAPSVRERVDDERSFGVARPIDLLQGAITPVVRRTWAAVGEGRHAVALGDAWVLNDPIVGQGANLGSRCAFILADAILAASSFDERFCRRVDALMWRAAEPVTKWSNAALEPPPAHVLDLLSAAADDQRVADGFIDGFDDPPTMWTRMSSPGSAAEFLARFRSNSTSVA
jgi:2-polyprenyl-6-methoxyphenol hydroxylase-like FAD-dependent oxidoreductase